MNHLEKHNWDGTKNVATQKKRNDKTKSLLSFYVRSHKANIAPFEFYENIFQFLFEKQMEMKKGWL